MRHLLSRAFFLFFMSLVPLVAHAQGRGQRGAAQAAKSIAPVDLTGYWVSVVSEDWRFRMMTPRKGDFESLPLNAEGRRVAEPGTSRRTIKPAFSAKRLASARSCANPAACTSHGRTTTL
jgi:hypothetical protein